MSKKIISTEKAPRAIGPYSQAVMAGNMLFVSGQIPVDPATGSMASDTIGGQTEQVMKNLMAILLQAGCDASAVVKTTCYLSDMANFQAFNEVYARYFTVDPPARATVAVKTLPLNVLVEVDAIAVI
jgi:2-iminobutanoate/2-iminopropanoate deaminase